MRWEDSSGGMAARGNGLLLLLGFLYLFRLLRLFCFLSHSILFVCWAAALDGEPRPSRDDDSCWSQFGQAPAQHFVWVEIRLRVWLAYVRFHDQSGLNRDIVSCLLRANSGSQ
jgi:hypothetical protein